MNTGTVTVVGGTGFLGRRIVACLIDIGVQVRVAVRHPDRASSMAASSGIEPVYVDIRDESSVRLAVAGSDAVINAVGLYVEHGADTFQAVHVGGALCVARQAAGEGVGRLVHLSGIGVDPDSPSPYVRARTEGEAAVRQAFAGATILRPSVLFGSNDAFINSLARLVRLLPAIPLFGGGGTRLQPVFVDDVAQAAVRALSDRTAAGTVFELGGGRIYTYRALLELLCRQIGRRRLLIPVPFAVWRVLARLSALLPRPPLTIDQVILMERDNVVGASARGFGDLGISPTSLENALPACLKSR